ncbi:alpha/beta hydrolase [Draconibacterium halophilum]|uniref:Alpha/beta hydrolase n=1 Tax=Draconibacterium halophilum TaxID=2706887 RepID=A0A6C0RC51_9BACT|nr:alpha/beta hydrolase [Draconibacterium halophilum]QIA07063.1 alpha/beta hydrolase [Draconibacterium halophilum]
MKRLSFFLLTVIALTSSVNVLFAQQEKQERKTIPGMGNLLIPLEIKPSDNSTSIVLEDISGTPKMHREVPENLTLTENVIFHETKSSDGDPMSMKMDIVRPADEEIYPCVIFITGGGFMWAPKNSNLYNRCEIATAGYVVASIEYHVVSNGLYSDAVKDVKAAIRFMRGNAQKYKLNPLKVAVWGESAGGYLTAMTATTNGVNDFDVGEYLNESSNVQAAIDAYGLSDLTKIGADYDKEAEAAHFTADAPEARYVHGKNSGLTILDKPEIVAKSNPVNYVDKKDPHFFLFTDLLINLFRPVKLC